MTERSSYSKSRPRTLLDAIIARFQESFGDAFRQDVALSRYTTSGLGGPADFFVTVRSVEEIIEAVSLARRQHIPYWVLGDGSNVLVSDLGMRGLVIRNRAKAVGFRHNGTGVVVQADSGVNLSSLARRCASRGLDGLTWASGIPGTVGGAVVGNAGAHSGDVAGSLRQVSILDSDLQIRDYRAEEMEYSYRSSVLKASHTGQGETDRVILTAEFNLSPASTSGLERRMAEIVEHRKETQPPGASMGCMFKNPPGDHAGRLMDEAELKGLRIGGAQISPVHANFIISDAETAAEDVRQLMAEAWHTVKDRFGVALEPEVELIGDWD